VRGGGNKSPPTPLAPGPACGTLLVPGVVNGITIPWPSQVVQGFSALGKGREPDEYLAMPDNGFGGKAPSKDFLLRAYYVKIDFKTAQGGTGDVEVRDFRRNLGDLGGGDSPPLRAPHRHRSGPRWPR
jgi:hypothetical protein